MKLRKLSKKLLFSCIMFSWLAVSGAVMAEGDPDEDAPLAALGEVPDPADNKMTPAKIELGKMLFFDPRLSGDASIACSDCHIPKEGWSQAVEISRGYPGTIHWRGNQTIVNSAYLGKLFWGGSKKSLEVQASATARGGVAGNGEEDVMEARLAFIPEYVELFRQEFGDEWPLIGNAWRAIAAFERTLIQRDTPLDNYLNGDDSALDDTQKAGLELFRGKANCIECHNGPMLSDEKYYNLGVPRHEGWLTDGLKQITFRFQLFAKGSKEPHYRKLKDDPGFYFQTKSEKDMGKFRTAPLRYLKYTAPYMHNGALFTLKDVVDFYNDGGGDNDFTIGWGKSKTPILKPLNLTDEEKGALVAFLESISGEEILMETPQLPKYQPLPAPIQ